MPYFNSLKLKFVDAINKLPNGTVHPKTLSADNTDFRLYELLKNDSRSNDRTGQNTVSALASSNELDINIGGGERDRTDDPLLAKQVLSQLSYTPKFWWVWLDSNQRPPPYQDGALTD